MTISRLAFLIVAGVGVADAQSVVEMAGQGIPSPCPAESFSWGITGVPATGSAVPLKAQLTILEVTRQVDRCSPKLFEICATGTHIPLVTVTLFDSTGRTEIMQLKLTNVVISGVHHAAGTVSPTPTETVGFSFAKIEYVYYSSTGPVNASYDLTSNTGF